MKRKYTENQINKLIANPFVNAVKYNKQIEYSPLFKQWAITQSINHPELSANQIFEKAGFEITMLGKTTASSRIREWKNKYINNNFITVEQETSNNNLDVENNILLISLLSRFDTLIDILNQRNYDK